MTAKDRQEIQRALGYIEGVADAAVDAVFAALIVEAVRVIDKIFKKEEPADEVD